MEEIGGIRKPEVPGGRREARGGETGTTRFGMEGSDTDGAGSGGILDDRQETDQ